MVKKKDVFKYINKLSGHTLTVPILGNTQRAAQLLPDPERNHLPEHGQFGGKDLGTGPLPASG